MTKSQHGGVARTPIDTAELERLDDILRDPLSGLTWDNRIMAADAIREVLAYRKAEAGMRTLQRAGCGLAFSEPADTRTEYRRSDLSASEQQVRALDPRIYRLNAEALAEIKATIDGESDQDIGHIIYGLLDEIAALTPAPGWRPIETISRAAQDVHAERQRQISVEGWDDTHDDCNDKSELAQAAACYALSGTPADEAVFIHGRWKDPRDLFWPWTWDRSWWKPTNRRRDLVKAGALILAEIERLDRATPEAEGGSDD